MNKNYWIAGAVLVIVIAVIGFFVLAHRAQAPGNTSGEGSKIPGLDTSTGTGDSTGNASVGATGASAIVTYTDTGFSPSSTSVSQGTTVTWVNKSSHALWVASGAATTHALYDGTTVQQHCVAGAPTSDAVFDECTQIAPGGSFSFTFTKTGTWTYLNHTKAADQGTVIVTAATSAGPIRANVIPE